MRRGLIAGLMAVMLVFGVTIGASADSIRKSIAVDYSGYTIKVDGQVVNTGNSQPFLVVDEGRTYVPARYLAESLGAKVSFDQPTNTVIVVTPRYVETVTGSTLTTYKLPYYGVSIKLPAGWTAQPDPTNLVNVAGADGVVVLNRVTAPPLADFNTIVNQVETGFRTTADFTITTSHELQVPGAAHGIELAGTIVMLGTTMPAVAHIVQQGENVWVMLAMYDQKTDADGSKATGYLNSFSLSQ